MPNRAMPSSRQTMARARAPSACRWLAGRCTGRWRPSDGGIDPLLPRKILAQARVILAAKLICARSFPPISICPLRQIPTHKPQSPTTAKSRGAMASGKDSAASAATAAHEQKAIAARARALKLGLVTMAAAQGGKAAKTATRGRNDATPAQQRLVEDPPEEQRFAAPILSAGPRSTPGRSFGATPSLAAGTRSTPVQSNGASPSLGGGTGSTPVQSFAAAPRSTGGFFFPAASRYNGGMNFSGSPSLTSSPMARHEPLSQPWINADLTDW